MDGTARGRTGPAEDIPDVERTIPMPSVLFVLTGARHWTLQDGSEHPTGFWAEELVAPYDRFEQAGWEIAVATPGAVVPVVDEGSLGEMGGSEEETAALRARLDELAPVLSAPQDLHEVDGQAYDVVFYPGGHGPMEDLAVDAGSGALLRERVAAGRPVALLCHAPAAALAAELDDDAGPGPFHGRRMTGFSNVEEQQADLADKAPWLLEDRLKEIGAEYEKAAEPWAPHVVVDGPVYTGQNPASSAALAERLLTDLG